MIMDYIFFVTLGVSSFDADGFASSSRFVSTLPFLAGLGLVASFSPFVQFLAGLFAAKRTINKTT